LWSTFRAARGTDCAKADVPASIAKPNAIVEIGKAASARPAVEERRAKLALVFGDLSVIPGLPILFVA
jgi:hypothetical protein